MQYRQTGDGDALKGEAGRVARGCRNIGEREVMDYRALVAASLEDVGVELDRVRQIEAGAMIYGDTGVLDSVYLVALIAAIEERLVVAQGAPVDLFAERDFALVDEFKDLRTLISFLEGRGARNAAGGEPCRGIRQ